MDVDESFFEQVGKIEQGALGAGSKDTTKGKENDTRTGRTSSDTRMTAGSDMGTKSLDLCPISPSGAKFSTRMRSKGATDSSPLIGLRESRPPLSTQRKASTEHALLPPPSTPPLHRRLPRQASIIVISSSEDEGPGGDVKRKGYGADRLFALAGRHAHNNGKARGGAVEEEEEMDVINVSDVSE
ncbi:hypothetical protein BS17DRAFT_118081 [Gyrodon lividus]|nr:hypothetical protein BS17DRAFT_118081 [Gyrodon lividus]